MCELALLFRNGHTSGPPVPCEGVSVVEKFISDLFPLDDDGQWPTGPVRFDLWSGYAGPLWLRSEDLTYIGVRYCEDRRRQTEVRLG